MTMVVEIIGWDGEHRQARLFDIPDAAGEALQGFVSSAYAEEELAGKLEKLRSEAYAAIAATPMSELDRFYRERLAAMYVWEYLADLEVKPKLTLEFPLR